MFGLVGSDCIVAIQNEGLIDRIYSTLNILKNMILVTVKEPIEADITY